ncbi:hypothetical protein [Nostoc sp. WHI]|uniref:hypothetical protein n=1 Tax=Nostoc sp. WHI TaxID=2650611 RepID=UPI0018C6BD2A|nr:hypothetical protein [Nostoc sp. WHI]
MTSAFARFPPRLQAAIVSNLGWSSLRPVQELAGHTLLDGNNAIVLAPTASWWQNGSFCISIISNANGTRA